MLHKPFAGLNQNELLTIVLTPPDEPLMMVKNGELNTQLITFTRASSATYFDSSGVLQTASANVPRKHYLQDGSGEYGFLPEKAATNTSTQSEDLSHGDWAKIRSTISTDVTIAPDGTSTADGLIASTDNNNHRVDKVLTPTLGVEYVWSAFVKAADKSFLNLVSEDTDPGSSITASQFNLNTGAVESTGSGHNAAGINTLPNGWFRVWIQWTGAASGPRQMIAPATAAGLSNVTYVGDGSTIDLYIWGVQREVGTYPTSYIPTVGSTVTRAADLPSWENLDTDARFNASEGTVYCEFKKNNYDAFNRVFAIDDGSNANRINLEQQNAATFSLNANVISASTTKFNASTNPSDELMSKVGLRYRENDYSFVLDGSLIGSSGTDLPVAVDTMGVGMSGSGTNTLDSIIKNMSYINKGETNAKMKTETT